MFTFIVTLIVIIAVLMILVVLAQNSKGGGLSSQFGGGSASQVMGVKKTGDFLEKLTWGLAISIFILCLSTSFILDNERGAAGPLSPNIEKANERNVAPDLGGAIPNTNTVPGSDTTETIDLQSVPQEE